MSDHIQQIYEELAKSSGIVELHKKIVAYQALGVQIDMLGSGNAHARVNIMGTERHVYFFIQSLNLNS